jgi:hypothetical protein
MIHHHRWIKIYIYIYIYIYFICSQIVVTEKFLIKVEWDLKRVPNLI